MKNSPGFYWPLTMNPSTSQLASLVPQGEIGSAYEDGYVMSVAGVTNRSDQAIRFLGEDKSCVALSASSTTHQCLFNPSTCVASPNGEPKGMSLSFWLNIPHSFDQQMQFVLDTRDAKSKKGVAIYYISSEDGIAFNNKITVNVSSNEQDWSLTVNGMVQPYSWMNFGIRWSAEVHADGRQYGLQIFVNEVPTAWLRSGILKDQFLANGENADKINFTIGCSRDGRNAMTGLVDEFAAWYWRLNDTSADQKPNATELGQVKNFCADITCSPPPYSESRMLPGDPTGLPEQFVYFEDSLADAAIQARLEQCANGKAIDGDCLETSGFNAYRRHPIECVDTKNELQAALLKPGYTGKEVIAAMVCVVNKAGSIALNTDDIDYLLNNALEAVSPLLGNETEITCDTKDHHPPVYMDLVQVVSKLSQLDIYADYWTSLHKRKKAGYTIWTQALRDWLVEISDMITPYDEYVVDQANHTVCAVTRFASQPTPKKPFVFPDYKQSAFKSNAISAWASVSDQLTVSAKESSGAAQEMAAAACVHDTYDTFSPAYLDSRINGLGSSKFAVNSRILSLAINAKINQSITTPQFSATFTVLHRKTQFELPFQKGAVLCAYWVNSRSFDWQIGAWDIDTCKLVSTNDAQTTCTCERAGDYAVLLEYKEMPVPEWAYYICIGTGLLSVIALFVYIRYVVSSPQLHNLVHIIYSNSALALMVALMFYLLTWAMDYRSGCIILSVLQQYCFCSAYTWQLLGGVCLFRATCFNRIGGAVLVRCFSVLGWFIPCLVVAAMTAVKAEFYGFGSRCFASSSSNYNTVYFGVFLGLFAVNLPLILMSAMCQSRFPHSSWSRAMIRCAIIGNLFLILINGAIWSLAYFVYIYAVQSQIPDFMFELLHTLQGVTFVLLLGLMNPAFRQAVQDGPVDGS